MDFDESRPIWLQLVDEFSRRIATAEWAPGAKVGSVRDLATEFGVNPNTVQRALNHLDAMGLTTTERTVGRFVTADPSLVSVHKARQAGQLVDDLITGLQGLGLGRDEAMTMLRDRWNQVGASGPGTPQIKENDE